MKANELRIGNWVKYEGRHFQMYVIAKDLPFLDTMEFGDGVVEWKDIEPIPLTEEWLIKFGFEKGGNWFDEGGMIELKEKEDAYVMLEDSYYHCSQDLFYVHQLQNLYFALTGQELQADETDQIVNL